MSTITVGKRTYLTNAPWLIDQQGTITPQFLDVSSLVPAEAVAYGISCPLFRTWADANGNIDVSASIRLPGYTAENYMQIACVAESGRAAYSNAVEVGGLGQVIVPVLTVNGARGFYWLIQGAQSCLNVGVNLTLALHWYEVP